MGILQINVVILHQPVIIMNGVGDKYVEDVKKAALLPPLTKTGTTLLISRPLDLSPQFLWGLITSYWDSQIDISALITCSGGNVYMTYFEIRESGY